VSRRRKSRREPRAAAAPTRPGRERADAQETRYSSARRPAPTWSLGFQLVLLAAVFAVVVLIAELAGAANLGVALGVGQIAFAIAVVYLLLRR
jgi:hypothetical protein